MWSLKPAFYFSFVILILHLLLKGFLLEFWGEGGGEGNIDTDLFPPNCAQHKEFLIDEAIAFNFTLRVLKHNIHLKIQDVKPVG